MKKQRKWKWIIVLACVLLLIAGGIVYAFESIQYDHVTINQSDEALGIQTPPVVVTQATTVENNAEIEKDPEMDQMVADSEQWNDKIINIALFGVDHRSKTEPSRSDSMMILSVDFQHHKVKLSSLMRDQYVPIDSHGKTKLNHAYAYGGPELAIKTINQVFGTDIRNYVTVDFFTLEKIIDTIGGIDLDVKDGEVEYVNQYMSEVSSIEGESQVNLTQGGMQTLNGRQAVAFARIRYYGDGDFERTERQRRVLMSMIDKVKAKGTSVIPSLLLQVSPYIETSLDRKDILSMAYKYLKDGNMTMEQERFPLDSMWKAGSANGMWIMKVDLEKQKKQVQDYIYQDIKPE